MIYTGIQKLSLVDFDTEISTTIFTGGCNFRCPFCHNFEFVVFEKDTLEVIKDEDIYKYLESRKHLLSAVVITGGEPTIHKDLKDAVKKIKNMGFKVKLDTNGTNPDVVIEMLEEKLIDYVAIDIKNSKELYPITTGLLKVDTEKISTLINYLISHDYDYEFRTTLIDNFHTEESINKIGEWIKGSKQMFIQRFVLSGNVPSKDLKEVPLDKALKYQEILKKYVENVNLRGY